jgi:disulfide bond formation protein DsbB
MTLNHFLDRWRFYALIAAALMLAAAHTFERFGGLAPCLLCLRQREVYWAILAAAAVFMVIVRLPGGPRWREATCMILAMGFAFSAGIAVYHAGAEWKFWPGPTACAGAGGVTTEELARLLSGDPVEVPRCDEAPWVFLGLSMAGWNAVISFFLAGLSLLAARRDRSKQ